MKPEEKVTFVTTHFVNAEYHKNHPQLVHSHEDELELLYIISGEGPYYVGGKEYFVSAGSLVICNAHVLHGEHRTQQLEKESCCCVLKDVCLEGLAPNTLIPPGADPVLVLGRDRIPLENLLLTLHRFSSQGLYREICQNLARAILQIVLEQLRLRQKSVPAMDRSEEALARQITDYLDRHYMEDISIDKLAGMFHISPCHISRFFKRATGIPPLKYIMNRRIGEAQKQLMNTDIQIGEIAAMVGIEDVAFFSRQFRKYVGITPSAFRAYHRSEKSTSGI